MVAWRDSRPMGEYPILEGYSTNFQQLSMRRLISDPRAASSPYHGRAYHDRRVAHAVAPLEI